MFSETNNTPSSYNVELKDFTDEEAINHYHNIRLFNSIIRKKVEEPNNKITTTIDQFNRPIYELEDIRISGDAIIYMPIICTSYYSILKEYNLYKSLDEDGQIIIYRDHPGYTKAIDIILKDKHVLMGSYDVVYKNVFRTTISTDRFSYDKLYPIVIILNKITLTNSIKFIRCNALIAYNLHKMNYLHPFQENAFIIDTNLNLYELSDYIDDIYVNPELFIGKLDKSIFNECVILNELIFRINPEHTSYYIDIINSINRGDVYTEYHLTEYFISEYINR